MIISEYRKTFFKYLKQYDKYIIDVSMFTDTITVVTKVLNGIVGYDKYISYSNTLFLKDQLEIIIPVDKFKSESDWNKQMLDLIEYEIRVKKFETLLG